MNERDPLFEIPRPVYGPEDIGIHETAEPVIEFVPTKIRKDGHLEVVDSKPPIVEDKSINVWQPERSAEWSKVPPKQSEDTSRVYQPHDGNR